MKRLFIALMLAAGLCLLAVFFRGLRDRMKATAAQGRQALEAVSALERGLEEADRNGEPHAEDGPVTGLPLEVRRFKRACAEWERKRLRRGPGREGCRLPESVVPPALQASMDRLAGCGDPAVVEALNALILRGSVSEAGWAAKVAARRQEILCFDAIWSRASARRGTSAELFRLLGGAASGYPRVYVAPLLAKQLVSEDYAVRDAACRMLAWCPSEQALPALCRLLGTSSMSERDAAVEALTALGKGAVPGLARIARGPRSLAREGALQALARIPDREAVTLAFDAALLEDALLRVQVLDGSVQWCREVLIHRETEDPLRVAQAESLAKAIHGVLCEALASPLEARRCAAVELMARLPLPEAMARIRKVLETEPHARVKALALQSVRHLRDPAAREVAWRDLLSSDDRLRGEAFGMLVQDLDELSMERLRPALAHADAGVRCTALRLLGRTRREEARDVLVAGTRDPEPAVVSEACSLLETFDRLEADIEWLRALCPVRDRGVRSSVSRMLAKLDTQEARGLLIDRLPEDPSGVIGKHLGRSEDPRVFWPLFEKGVRMGNTVVTAPGAVRRMAADHWEELLKMLDSPERNRRVLAASLLGGMEADVYDVKKALRRRIRTGDEVAMIHGTMNFVKQSDEEILGLLRKVMEDEKEHASELAFQYYNTHTALRDVAQAWLRKHGFEIITVTRPAVISEK